MKYFSLAAHNRELVLITDMESFTHYFCYSTKQKKGEVREIAEAASPEDFESPAPGLPLEIDAAALGDDDEL